MSYESDVEAESARLREREKAWRAAAGGLEEPEMLAAAVNYQSAMLEKAQDRERTALRERDEAREDLAIAREEPQRLRDEADHLRGLVTERTQERDEARAGRESAESQAAHWQRAANEFDQQRTRAEVDCASMREALEPIRRWVDASDSVHVLPESAEQLGPTLVMQSWRRIARECISPTGAALLERLRAAEDELRASRKALAESELEKRRVTAVVERCQKEFRVRDMDAEDLPQAVEVMLNAYRVLLSQAQGWRAEHRAAVAVVEAARKTARGDTSRAAWDALDAAIAAYDALCAKGETYGSQGLSLAGLQATQPPTSCPDGSGSGYCGDCRQAEGT